LPCETDSDREHGRTDMTTGIPMVSRPVTLASLVMPIFGSSGLSLSSLGWRNQLVRASDVRLEGAAGKQWLAVDVELEGPHEDKKCSLGQILHFNISDMLKFKV
jgi:hypothetical protein